MRTALAATLVLAAASQSFAQEPIPAPADPLASRPASPPVDGTCPERWSFRANALFLHRSEPKDDLVFSDAFTGATLLDASQFNLGWEAGWEIAATLNLNRIVALELRYFQVDGWDASTSVSDTRGVILPTNPPIVLGVGAPLSKNAAYQSLLRSAEINARLRLSEGLSVLAGFRYLAVDETLDLSFSNGLALFFTTQNDLFGAQLGLDCHRTWGRLELQAVGKGGIYGNQSEATFQFQFPGLTFGSKGRDSHTAFAGELTFGGSYRITDRISAQAGYQLLVIDGVAFASDQINRTNVIQGTIAVANSGTPFYHGAYVGLGVRW